MLVSQRVVQLCLFLVGAIAVLGGTLQMYLGQPDTLPRLDNVHRFMAGVYLGTGIISFWAASTISPGVPSRISAGWNTKTNGTM